MAIVKYDVKNGKKWMFKEYLGVDPITGKKRWVTRRGFKTKKEAEAELTRLKFEFNKGVLSSKRGVLYGYVFELWAPLYAETVKGSTYLKTMKNFKNHILPIFSKIPIEKITPSVCQQFANDLSKKLVNYKAVFNSAKRVYTYAYKVGLTNQSNPFERVILPKPKKTNDNTPFLEKEELKEVLGALKKEGNEKWYTYFRLLAYTGMRRGEALALTWSDVDFKNKTININKTVSVDANGKPCINTTKTTAGERIIDVDNGTLKILSNFRKSSPNTFKSIYVFANEKGGFTALSKPRHNLQRIIKKYNFKQVTVHSFRHTHCSLLFEAGWSLKEVQERLGHSDIKTTMDVYAHVTAGQKTKSMESFVNLIGEA